MPNQSKTYISILENSANAAVYDDSEGIVVSQQNNSTGVFYDMALDRLKSQISRMDGVDTKIGVTFGLANGLLIALLGFGTFLERPISLAVQLFVGASVVAYLVTLALLLITYRMSHWDYRPHLVRLQEICADPQYHDNADVIKEWIADECVRAYEYNKPLIANKIYRATQALVGLGAQAILLALAGVASLLN